MRLIGGEVVLHLVKMFIADVVQLLLPFFRLAALVGLVEVVKIIHSMECVLGYSVRFRYFFEEFSVFGRQLGDRTLVLAHLANEVEVVVGV